MASHRSPARATVVALLLMAACQDSTTPSGSPLAPTEPLAARAPQAQDRLEAIFQRSSVDVLALPGTVFADNDERVGKVVFGVEHAGVGGSIHAVMARMGVARDDYAIEVTQPIHFKATLRDEFRPTIAGTQINFGNYVCTMGFNADHAGGRSFVTNSHCTSKQGGTEGTLYYQPLQSSHPTAIATEVDDPAYVKDANCPKGKTCRYSDAARALYAAGTASNRGQIAQTTGVNNGSLVISGSNPLFLISSQDNSTTNFGIGTAVNKVGRTTGWTRGNVTRTCVNTGVSGSRVLLYCQTFVSDPGGAQVVGGGDSGSSVWRGTSGSNVQLVGLLWGGSSDNKTFVFSPLQQVQRELGTLNALQ